MANIPCSKCGAPASKEKRLPADAGYICNACQAKVNKESLKNPVPKPPATPEKIAKNTPAGRKLAQLKAQAEAKKKAGG